MNNNISSNNINLATNKNKIIYQNNIVSAHNNLNNNFNQIPYNPNYNYVYLVNNLNNASPNCFNKLCSSYKYPYFEICSLIIIMFNFIQLITIIIV